MQYSVIKEIKKKLRGLNVEAAVRTEKRRQYGMG